MAQFRAEIAARATSTLFTVAPAVALAALTQFVLVLACSPELLTSTAPATSISEANTARPDLDPL
ncbi:hypothetical protein [Methylobacterium sp. WSM2598]|uniref:hypothetical protein n=1 Tax=Methylobacterium sp. WSM2598 TaxID=398261 RepID=UPI0012F6FC3A|nr:hypothetical protein [Methylobacterium sp. WSM2598]